MHIIDKILRREEFIKRPPVLVDIGASGTIHPKWRRIAQYAVCIAFDADSREMGYAIHEKKGYRKLYIINRVLVAHPVAKTQFYLTKSPFCSSILKPDRQSLDHWSFGGLFDVAQTTTLESVTLHSVMETLGIDKIDWFKVDSQGTDLRLFRSLGDELVARVLVAEFEPGIMDAYEGEDKLSSLMAYMDKQPFWMGNLEIKGTQRIKRELFEHKFSEFNRKILKRFAKIAPGWGEVTYLNTFSSTSNSLDKRDFLLGWIFAVLEKHYCFAFEIALKASGQFHDPIFQTMQKYAESRIKFECIKIPSYLLCSAVRFFKQILGVRK